MAEITTPCEWILGERYEQPQSEEDQLEKDKIPGEREEEMVKEVGQVTRRGDSQQGQLPDQSPAAQRQAAAASGK